jgi:integrase/recombinase XerD
MEVVTMREQYEKLIREYVNDCRIRNFTESVSIRYAGRVRDFGAFLSERGKVFETVAKEDLVDYVSYLRNERKIKAVTLGNYFSALNSFYDFLLYHERIGVNLVPVIRKRYLYQYKKDEGKNKRRKVISVKEMSDFLNSILSVRDKAICMFLLKTGVRRHELKEIDISDIDWTTNSVRLKEKKKRSNLVVLFDDECARVLKQWLYVRKSLYVKPGCDALFVGNHGTRLGGFGVYGAVVSNSKRFGIYDTSSQEKSDHFGPHNFRHCFTTYLLENGMSREYVQELRGDARSDAVDLYNHISLENLREAYLAAMPQFGL